MYFFTSECRGFFIFILQRDFWDVQKQRMWSYNCVTAGGRQLVVPMVWRDTETKLLRFGSLPPPTPRHLDLQGTMRSLGVGTKSSLWTGHDIYREISRGLQRLLLFLLNQLSPSLTHLVPLSNQSVIVGIDGQCTFDLIRWGVTSPLPLKSQ